MKVIAFITDYQAVDRIIDGGRGPGLYPGVHFRRTRPWIKAMGEWRAEGSSLDHLNLTFVAEKPLPSRVIEQVALMVAEERAEYF